MVGKGIDGIEPVTMLRVLPSRIYVAFQAQSPQVFLHFKVLTVVHLHLSWLCKRAHLEALFAS